MAVCVQKSKWVATSALTHLFLRNMFTPLLKCYDTCAVINIKICCVIKSTCTAEKNEVPRTKQYGGVLNTRLIIWSAVLDCSTQKIVVNLGIRSHASGAARNRVNEVLNDMKGRSLETRSPSRCVTSEAIDDEPPRVMATSPKVPSMKKRTVEFACNTKVFQIHSHSNPRRRI